MYYKLTGSILLMRMGTAPSYVCVVPDSCSELVATVAKCGLFSNQFSGVRLAGLNGSMEVTAVGVVIVNSISVIEAKVVTKYMSYKSVQSSLL